MATGGSVFGGVPFVGPVLFLVMGLYRVVSIVRGLALLIRTRFLALRWFFEKLELWGSTSVRWSRC